MEPWDDFLVRNEEEEEEGDAARDSEWEWLRQVCDLAREECCSQVAHSFQRVTLTLRLDAGSYVLKLCRTDHFPVTAPGIESSLGAAFGSEWQNGDTLRSLYLRFIERSLRIDYSVRLCSDISYPFTFRKWMVDEDDPTCISVTISYEEGDCMGKSVEVELYVLVDWSEPNAFPRAINSSAPECLQGLRFDEWDASSLFAENFHRIFCNMI